MNSHPSSRQPSGVSALRSLQSQMSNAVIDYSPWSRQQRPSPGDGVRRAPKSAGTTITSVIVALPPIREENRCSARCRHKRSDQTPAITDKPVIPENPAKIQWLQLQLHIYRTRIQTFTQHEHDLEMRNAQLRQMINKEENSSHDSVADNIRRFDQYQKTLILVERKQFDEKQELLDAVDHERQTFANELEMYENQIVALENQIGDCQQTLKQLKTFKDSEYPEKEQALQKFLQQLDETKLFNSEDIDELNRILERQQEQFTDNVRRTTAQLREAQATAAFADMHVSYRLVALDNDRMKEEVAVQEEKVRLLHVEHDHLIELNAKLKRETTEAFDSANLFPHVFRPDKISMCSPEMDIVLDLPQQPPPLPV